MTNRGPSMFMGSVQWGPDRYPTLWIRDDGDRAAVPIHRLVAYAHGELDHIRFESDPREIHHVDGDEWNNRPENLIAVESDEHGRITRAESAGSD